MNITLLFKSVIYTSLMGSIVAVMIIFLRGLLRSRLSASWQYYIWFLLIIRLILPYAPQSNFSVFNLMPSTGQKIEAAQLKEFPRVNAETPEYDKTAVGITGIAEANDNIDKPVLNNAPVKRRSLNDYIKIISFIWIAAAGIMLLYTLVLNIGFSLNMRRYPFCTDRETLEILEKCKSEMNIKSDIAVVYYRNRMPPFIFGIFRPRLMIPDIVFDKLPFSEKRYIFMHELAHLKRKDILINFIMIILKSIHWFNPIIWYACYKMQEDCEIACDACVLSHIEPAEYKKYGETAIDLLNVFSRPYRVPGTAGITGHGTGIKRRIDMITRYKKNSLIWTLAAVVIFAAAGFVSLTDANQTKGLIPLNELSNDYSAAADVKGSGIVISLSDRDGIDNETDSDAIMNGLVHSSDVTGIVKELKVSGAYAVSVNDIRITKYSQIATQGMYITVDGNKCSPPFIIKAAGNTDIMEEELNRIESIMWEWKFRKLEVKVDKVQELYIPAQGEAEKKLTETRAANVKNTDTVKSIDEIYADKEYLTYGYNDFWAYPYVIYNGHRYEILIRDNVPENMVGKELGNVKRYLNPSWIVGLDMLEEGKVLTDTDGDSNYLPLGIKIYQFKRTSTGKLILVNYKGIYRRAVIVGK